VPAGGYYILLLMFIYSALVFFFFHGLIMEVAQPITTKLCHMFDGDPDL